MRHCSRCGCWHLPGQGPQLGTGDADDAWLALATRWQRPGVAGHIDGGRRDAGGWALALPWDLTFPEVFWPTGRGCTGGFDAVLGNPPWDIMQPNAAEFLAVSICRSWMRAERRRERSGAVARGCQRWRRWRDLPGAFARQHRMVDGFIRIRGSGTGVVMGGKLDLYRVFAERMVRLAGPRARSGWWCRRPSTPTRGRRAFVGCIYERRSWSNACHSRTGRSSSISMVGSSSRWSWHDDLDRRKPYIVPSILANLNRVTIRRLIDYDREFIDVPVASMRRSSNCGIATMFLGTADVPGSSSVWIVVGRAGHRVESRTAHDG